MNVNKTQTRHRPHLKKDQRLPRYMKEVEKVVHSAKACERNFKTLMANSRLRGAILKKVYNVAANVLKYYNYIQKIIDKIQLLEKEKFLRKEIASIVIYEMIFGKNSLPGNSKVIVTIQSYESDIRNAHEELQGKIDSFLAKEIHVPRYVRVHTLVTTVPYVIKDLEQLGFKHIVYGNISEEKYYEMLTNLEGGSFLIDFHFKDILVFPQHEKLIYLDLYKKGHIFLQDKASCIPVHALNPQPGYAVLDACAAPGMKTIHIASKMENKGILIACERDKSRFESLKEMIQHGSVKICKLLCKDFKLLDPNDQAYSTVEYILLDPSCSGSGMVSRMDEVTDTEDSKNKERLKNLAGFQIILLKHALSFPSVKRVVYSTCSVNEEENEYVVHEALNSYYGTFKLVSVMPEWPDRGSENFEFGNLCLKTIPEKHLTNGFFVAMFERVDTMKCNTEMHFTKNKKYKTNTNLVNEDYSTLAFEKQQEKELKKHNKERRMNKISDGNFNLTNDSNTKHHLSEFYKENKFEYEKLKNKSKASESSTSDLVNKISESYENFNQNQDEEHGSEQIQIECLTKKRNNKLPSESQKEIQENLKDMPSELLECVVENILLSNRNTKSDVNSSLCTTERRKRKRNPSLETQTEITENDDAKDLCLHKKKKKRKDYSENEVSLEEAPALALKKKKSKKHLEGSFHYNDCNSSLIIDSLSMPCDEFSNLSGIEKLDNLSKHGNNVIDHPNKNSQLELSKVSSELIPEDSKETVINNFIGNDSKRKKKSKKHKVEKTDEIDIIGETDEIHIVGESVVQKAKDMCGPVENDIVSNKKKHKKHKTARTDKLKMTDEIIPYSPDEAICFSSGLKNKDQSKKSKKHKNKEVEKSTDCEITLKTPSHNSEVVLVCDSLTSKENKKHEIEMSNNFEEKCEIIFHNSEEMCSSLQSDNTVNKKSKHKKKSKKYEIEKQAVSENMDETLISDSIINFNKNNEKTEDFEKTFEIISHNTEEKESSSIQSLNTVNKKSKHKNKKQVIQKPVSENIDETFSYDHNTALIFDSAQNCQKSKESEIEKLGSSEKDCQIILQNSEQMCASTENDRAVIKKSKKYEAEKPSSPEKKYDKEMNMSGFQTNKKNKKSKRNVEIQKNDFNFIEDCAIISDNKEEINSAQSSKKSKKHKKNEFNIENPATNERIDKSYEGFISDLPKNGKNKDSKSRKYEIEKKKDAEKECEIISYNVEDMYAPIQGDNTENRKNKKHKKKKREIEKEVSSENIEEALISDCQTNKKAKKQKGSTDFDNTSFQKKKELCNVIESNYEKNVKNKKSEFEKNDKSISCNSGESFICSNSLPSKKRKDKICAIESVLEYKEKIEKELNSSEFNFYTNSSIKSNKSKRNKSQSKHITPTNEISTSAVEKSNQTGLNDSSLNNSMTLTKQDNGKIKPILESLPQTEKELETVLFNDFVEQKTE